MIQRNYRVQKYYEEVREAQIKTGQRGRQPQSLIFYVFHFALERPAAFQCDVCEYSTPFESQFKRHESTKKDTKAIVTQKTNTRIKGLSHANLSSDSDSGSRRCFSTLSPRSGTLACSAGVTYHRRAYSTSPSVSSRDEAPSKIAMPPAPSKAELFMGFSSRHSASSSGGCLVNGLSSVAHTLAVRVLLEPHPHGTSYRKCRCEADASHLSQQDSPTNMGWNVDLSPLFGVSCRQEYLRSMNFPLVRRKSASLFPRVPLSNFKGSSLTPRQGRNTLGLHIQALPRYDTRVSMSPRTSTNSVCSRCIVNKFRRKLLFDMKQAFRITRC